MGLFAPTRNSGELSPLSSSSSLSSSASTDLFVVALEFQMECGVLFGLLPRILIGAK